MNIKIRKANISESEKISKLRINTIKEINSLVYDAQQIKTLVDKNDLKSTNDKIDRGILFIAIQDNEILGCISFYFKNNKNFIGGLYVKSNLIKKGIGKKLVNFVENIAMQKNLKKLTLYSTPNAVGFYEKLGYNILKNEFGYINSVKFPLIEMEREIS
jgi:N-acetylglutamate synthase-like GNAT family acetyltransferase